MSIPSIHRHHNQGNVHQVERCHVGLRTSRIEKGIYLVNNKRVVVMVCELHIHMYIHHCGNRHERELLTGMKAGVLDA